jgi:aminopeptidase Y
MYRLYVLSFFYSLILASPTQHPLLHTADQQTLINTKPLVSSQALQDDINEDNLLKRAKHLFKLAELADHEYNHPTRVIGSDGNRSLLQNNPFKPLTYCWQATGQL